MFLRLSVLFLCLTSTGLYAQSPKYKLKDVIFARENIRRHALIKKRDIEIKSIPERFTPKQPYTKSLDEVVGKYARYDIYMGEPIIKMRVGAKEEIPYVSFKIEQKNDRVVSVHSKTTRPPKVNSRVKIVFTDNDEKNKPKTIANNLRVIANEKAANGYYFTLLEAPLGLSLKIILAQKLGTFQLVNE